MQKHYNITVKGKVQGVWYRKNTQEKAIALQITGNVRNLPNGNVYIEAEGDKNQLNLLLEWCAIGPEFAKVDAVSFEEGDLQLFKSFDILR
ncbi:acylphosphatase [Aquimarina atlantica]|uniref:acylphosphatase n=1 Tax=Aquimarina atlantica TaxID=1317122 RepID=A0A023BYN9_9FLAO|nr:acylphosphatase [Aquimarina atlantica]EZH74773.1 acylphosphatase [Aquimarina atlantica]